MPMTRWTIGAVFAVSGGGRRLEVHFEHGYPAAQIFAPAAEDVVCFEPMTAPTDALRRGGYRCARPANRRSRCFRSAFSTLHLRHQVRAAGSELSGPARMLRLELFDMC